MGSHDHQPVEVDPQTLQHAREFWCNFTKMTQYGVISIMTILGLMAFFLV